MSNLMGFERLAIGYYEFYPQYIFCFSYDRCLFVFFSRSGFAFYFRKLVIYAGYFLLPSISLMRASFFISIPILTIECHRTISLFYVISTISNESRGED